MIPYEERKKVYLEAIERFGSELQIIVAIEEMAELQKEICKSFRGKANLENIAEEIADSTIMLEQLRLIFDVNAEVIDEMDAKVTRLAKDRLGMEGWT